MECNCHEMVEDDEGIIKAPWGCEIHVSCDQDCQALRCPVLDADFMAAYEHWRNHSQLGGCSHAR